MMYVVRSWKIMDFLFLFFVFQQFVVSRKQYYDTDIKSLRTIAVNFGNFLKIIK